MLERITELPAGIVGVRAHGRVSAADYRAVIARLFDEPAEGAGRLRVLLHFAPDFVGVSAGAAIEDLRLIRSWERSERVAVVGGPAWVRGAVELFGALLPVAMRHFDEEALDAAIEWLGEAPAGSLAVELLGDAGVVVIEPRGPLRVVDFDALAGVVDPYIEARGGLRGLVIRVGGFPGWEGLGALIRHVRFVRDHHRAIARVAAVSDAAFAERGAAIADHFVAAELRHFPAAEIEAAIAWAAGAGEGAA